MWHLPGASTEVACNDFFVHYIAGSIVFAEPYAPAAGELWHNPCRLALRGLPYYWCLHGFCLLVHHAEFAASSLMDASLALRCPPDITSSTKASASLRWSLHLVELAAG
mmetsp:Transcript_70193/g.168230  ORF Transcript_70193/g.168230 Transcript_70193/m.168230 type:complete len:109 (-) Transcript_70193:159-485(-)